jgi:TrmH family RNA methyltransferase
MDLITSPQNQYVKLFRSLATAKGRKEHGLFAIEGVHLVEEMLAAGWRAQVGYVCPELLKNQTLARRLKKSVDMLVEVAAPVFKEMSDTVTPQGIAAVVPLPRHTLETVPAGPGVVLAVHEVRDPGNMGTMIRTADAAGALGVLAVGDCVDFTSPNWWKCPRRSWCSGPGRQARRWWRRWSRRVLHWRKRGCRSAAGSSSATRPTGCPRRY